MPKSAHRFPGPGPRTGGRSSRTVTVERRAPAAAGLPA